MARAGWATPKSSGGGGRWHAPSPPLGSAASLPPLALVLAIGSELSPMYGLGGKKQCRGEETTNCRNKMKEKNQVGTIKRFSVGFLDRSTANKGRGELGSRQGDLRYE